MSVSRLLERSITTQSAKSNTFVFYFVHQFTINNVLWICRNWNMCYICLMEIQEMIKFLRKDMSQQEIAQKIGSSQAQVQRFERGQVPNYDLGKRIESLYVKRIQVLTTSE